MMLLHSLYIVILFALLFTRSNNYCWAFVIQTSPLISPSTTTTTTKTATTTTTTRTTTRTTRTTRTNTQQLYMGGYDATVINNNRNIEFYTLEGGMCPYATRTLITLIELNLNFDTIEIPRITPKPDWYINTINPLGKVPALRIPNDNNVIIYESAICNEYLVNYYNNEYKKNMNNMNNKNNMNKNDDSSSSSSSEEEENTTTTTTTLMPIHSSSQCAKIRILNNHYDTIVGKAQFTYLMNKDITKDDELKQNLENGLDLYETTLQQHTNGPYLLGQHFTLADIHIIPFIIRLFITLEYFKNYQLPIERFPLLYQWYNLCLQRQSIITTTKTKDEIIQVYKSFFERNSK